MFQEWDFLVAEIWGLLALATALGLVAGWIFWGRGAAAGLAAELDTLRADLERSRAMHADKDDRIRALDAEIASLRTAQVPVTGIPTSQRKVRQVRPKPLASARAGGPDDLTQIKGIGPKLEALCHGLGFYHYDQIAAWSAAEVAWVDDNLEDFKGRVTRDNWVAQARALSAPVAAESPLKKAALSE